MRNKIKYIPIMILTLVTALSAVGLSSARVKAATEGTKNASVTVEKTCAFTNEASSYSTALSAGSGMSVDTTGLSDEKKPPFTVACNDLNGFLVKAVGFSPDKDNPTGKEGNTDMYGPDGTIPTGTSGTNSYWAFHVTPTATGTTVTSDYAGASSWYAVPATAQTVADFAATHSGVTVTGSVRADYKVYVSGAQPASSYTGAMKYTILGNS